LLLEARGGDGHEHVERHGANPGKEQDPLRTDQLNEIGGDHALKVVLQRLRPPRRGVVGDLVLVDAARHLGAIEITRNRHGPEADRDVGLRAGLRRHRIQHEELRLHDLRSGQEPAAGERDHEDQRGEDGGVGAAAHGVSWGCDRP
jgi:hypothetical protein